MISIDQEGARQVGLGLSFCGSRARPWFGVTFARFVVLAVLALVVCKVGFSLAELPA
jgi:hypothetical protein